MIYKIIRQRTNIRTREFYRHYKRLSKRSKILNVKEFEEISKEFGEEIHKQISRGNAVQLPFLGIMKVDYFKLKYKKPNVIYYSNDIALKVHIRLKHKINNGQFYSFRLFNTRTKLLYINNPNIEMSEEAKKYYENKIKEE